MKFKLLSKKLLTRNVIRRFGVTTTAIVLGVLMSNSSNAQTIFSNPVGINVGSVAVGKDFHVNGPIRFNDLAGTGTRVVTCDPNGDLGFTTISGTLPLGTAPGQSLLWDGSNWINNDYLRVNGFGGPSEILEIGQTAPIDFVRTIHYGGNVALDLFPGTLGDPFGTWMSHGWREIGNSLPPGENFTGTRSNWDGFASNIGLTDRPSGGPERDLNIQMQDFTVPAGDPLTNRIIFSGVSGLPGSLGVEEYATILGNGNVGIGLNSPLIKLQVQDGNIGQASAGAFGAIGPGNRWTAIGGRIPFGGSNPLIRQEGIRTQWERYGVGLGLTDRASSPIKDAILTFQDANADFPGGVLSQNNFIIGARDGIGTGSSALNVRSYLFIQGSNGNTSIGLNSFAPNSKLVITGDGTTAATSSLDVQNNSLFVRDDGFVGIGTAAPFGFPLGAFIGGGGPLGLPVRLSVEGTVEVEGDYITTGGLFQASDEKLKRNFNEMNDGWKRILDVQPYSYTYVQDHDELSFNTGTNYGFKAQDVKSNIPELAINWNEEYMAVNYVGFVPFLTAGMQEHEARLKAVEESTNVKAVEALEAKNAELEAKNNELEARLEKLEGQLAGICNLPCVQDAINQNTQEGELNDQPQLFQNEPNPFGSKTTIKYYVPANANNAAIKVLDNSGKQLGEYQLKTGKGQLEISAGTIPAGSYNYSLYVDNILVDTKKMVIINY